MASRGDVQESVIEKLDAIYASRKDKSKEPKAFSRICEAYFEAFHDIPAARLRGAMDRVVTEFEGPFWPTPATIRKFMPDEIEGPKAIWQGVPAYWRWDNRLPDLRNLCRWDGEGDPLIAIANSLATGIQTDPWRCMRNAMALRSNEWEEYGGNGDKWPTGSPDCIFNARKVVERYAHKVGISVDLSNVKIDQPQIADWSNEPALD